MVTEESRVQGFEGSRVAALSAEIKSEDLPERYQELVAALNAKLPGIPAIAVAIVVSQEFGGLLNLYFPRLDCILKKIRDRKIEEELGPTDYRALARQYNLCESSIRKIVKRKRSA